MSRRFPARVLPDTEGVSDSEAYAARTRAARGYAGLKHHELAALLNVSVRTLNRMESGKRPPDLEEREAIAAACGVPPAFMEVGFAPLGRPISDLERSVHDLRSQFTELRAAVVALAAGNLRHTRELLGLDEKDRPARFEGDVL